MRYRNDERSGNALSVLGFGCMRLPGSLGRIDIEKSEKLLMRAYEQGVNYFDTAYFYPGSEEAVGEILQRNAIREKVFLATKLPHTACKKTEDFDLFLAEQKRRLRTEYLDYYLIHNISDFKQWTYLCSLGIENWIAEKKKSGEIRQIGFSYHGSKKDFVSLIDAFGWDFVQIQYNYVNINYQAGREGLQYAAQKGLPVIIMEPLLGGKLAGGLPAKAMSAMQEAGPGSTPVSWALNWLWNQPEVTVVLSGMNEPAQLEENLALAQKAEPGMFGKAQERVIDCAIEAFHSSNKVGCTGCNYCMPCPKNINIPGCFSAYNESFALGWGTGFGQYMNVVGAIGENPRFAGDCAGCGSCERQCPQGIAIRSELKKVKRRFEIPGIKQAIKLMRRTARKGPRE